MKKLSQGFIDFIFFRSYDRKNNKYNMIFFIKRHDGTFDTFILFFSIELKVYFCVEFCFTV